MDSVLLSLPTNMYVCVYIYIYIYLKVILRWRCEKY